MNTEEIKKIIIDAGGNSEVARRVGVDASTMTYWSKRGIPALRVIDWCQAVEWRRTPHQVAPHLYPHPDDGLPVGMRGGYVDHVASG